ncbi:sporulation protein YqfD [Alteribacillus bidgolensis]|uniref:Similar to stage IV sporulation protein n=1 Tax=Alteribacillus bidgolensis TaxID=930129 RepID=A0A1G8NZP4_9BACI|nr:sporulation protein YqfD [Alteribacillus bidgolensis]SDI85713.1 similar to stage IV sporulation protein [Alteribacillus bidgolensis]
MNRRHGPSDIYVKLTGNYTEAVVNQCLREGVIIKNITRAEGESMECFIPSSELSYLERIAEESDCEVEVLKVSLIEKYTTLMKKRAGFIAGMLMFIILLILLSQMIWKIEIEGAQPVLEHNIQKNLQEMGITTGTFAFFLPSPEEIQKEILEKTEGTTWIGVEKRGTTYHFEVVEQSLPEKETPPAPRHVIAKKTAVINTIYAEKGQVLVKRNELVHEGQILISGFIGKDKHARTVAAEGEVLGETWYKVSVEIPMKPQADTLTGKSEKKYFLKMFGYELPVWGFSAESAFEVYKKSERKYDLELWGKEFPINWNVTTFQESNIVNQSSSSKETLRQAKYAAENKIKSRLGGEAVIKEGKILHEESQNGKVKLVMHYQVLEDITSEAPIIQGE